MPAVVTTNSLRRVSQSTARARLRGLALPPAVKRPVEELLAELGELVELPVDHIQRALFGDRTHLAGTKAIERLIKSINAAATEHGVDLRMEIRGGKRLGSARRMVGFSAENLEPADENHLLVLHAELHHIRCSLEETVHALTTVVDGQREILARLATADRGTCKHARHENETT